jgi:BirA family biotin operon repressor/biotin-[acetyl-CoA-carboxylase] ligase
MPTVKHNNMKNIQVQTCASTQGLAKELLSTTTAPFFIVSDVQTNGYGQRGRIWESMNGNLHITFVVPWKKDDSKIPSFAITIATMLHDTIKYYVPAAKLKLPNDIYINDKKIAGMITEKYHEQMLIGIGINIKHAPIDTATCMYDHKIMLDKQDLIALLSSNITQAIL